MGGSKWAEGIDYTPGEIVKYMGKKYKLLQPHKSQGDWTPNLVPALWHPVEESGGSEGSGDELKKKDKKDKKKKKEDGGESGGSEGDDKKKKKEDKEKKKKDKEDKKKEKHGDGEHDGEDKKKDKDKDKKKDKHGEPSHGDDHDDHEKKEKDKKKDKDKKADKVEGLVAATSGLHISGSGVGFASSLDWVTAARKVAAEFQQQGPKGPVTWLLVEGGPIPAGGVVAGEESDRTPLFVARAYYEGAIHIGRVSAKGAFIGHNGKEVKVDIFEILLGDSRAIKWVPSSELKSGARPVEAGSDPSGKIWHIAQTRIAGGVIPAKATDETGALVAINGAETLVKEFNVLVYA